MADDTLGDGFFIAGIGASAGGLQALTAFFDALPRGSGAAFVVVQHLDPSTESHSAKLIATHTDLPVTQIEDGMSVERGHVYVIAPDRLIVLEGGVLRSRKRTERAGAHHPIDAFFKSLAADQGERAIAVILSGTGTNGSTALADVKDGGGAVFAQSPETAEFDGMPRAAIATGVVDKVGSPQELAAAIAQYVARASWTASGSEPREPTGVDGGGDIAPILALLRRHSALSIDDYKNNMITRRIRRRMGLAGITDYGTYAAHLEENPAELDALSRDALILVTGFFRDAEAWDVLRAEVVAPLIASTPPEHVIRAWLPGCATGQEAYSLAMMLEEEANAAGSERRLEIFVTDVSNAAIAAAREGRYPRALVEDVSEARLERFFDDEGEQVRVKAELREQMVFSPHDVIRDPPFSNLDLVLCRNLLIYLTPETQSQIIALFHFALREGGCLFLGSAEHLGAHEGLFSTVSKKWRIFRREGGARHDTATISAWGDRRRLPILSRGPPVAPTYMPERTRGAKTKFADYAARELAGRFAPAAVLIDHDLNILYFHGDTSPYLSQKSGDASLNLVSLADDVLAARIKRLVPEALEANEPRTAEVLLADGDSRRIIRATVWPVSDRGHVSLFLVSFEEAPSAPPARRRSAAQDTSRDDLAADNAALRKELREVVEDAAHDREDLKASNEEVVSMNEELRATNEELESSKEELQSLNEELTTLNRQLRSKVGELQKRTDDLNNLLSSTEIATVFLDRDLRVTWFTPAVTSLLNLVASDVGRAVGDFSPKFADGDFLGDMKKVLRTLIPAEREVKAEGGRWFIRRVIPYRTGDDRIDGLVVTFVDISDRHRREDEVRAAKEYAELIVETVREPLIILDVAFRVVSANAAFYQRFAVEPAATEHAKVFDLGNGQWDIPELRRLLELALTGQGSFDDFEVEHTFESIGHRIMLVNARRVDGLDYLLVAIEDVTERRRHENEQRVLTAELSHRVKNALAVVQAVAQQTISRSASLEGFREAFLGRLAALARAHGQLMSSSWRSTDLRDLARDVLDTLAIDPARVQPTGPSIRLPPKKSLALAMALHELGTNSIKHGSLSQNGELDLRWDVEDGVLNGGVPRVRLVWQERGGPPTAPPQSRGFGLDLIEKFTPYELGGGVELNFAPEGVRCVFTFPTGGVLDDAGE